MITRKGAGFLAAAFALFILGRLTQVGWLYLVDAVLWGVILVSAAVPWLNVFPPRALRWIEGPEENGGAPSPTEGDPVVIRITLRNSTFWPRYVIGLFYDCPLEDPSRRTQRFFVTELAGSGQVSMLSNVSAYQRGSHQLGPLIMEASAPFGLFRRRIRLTDPETILVYPKLYPLARLALADSLAGSEPGGWKTRLGADLAGSRHYLPGDPLCIIHWRNTARVGQPMVKEFDSSQGQTLHLIYDATQVWGHGKETTLEYGIKILASAAAYARRRQVPAQVWGGGLAGEIATSLAAADVSWRQLLRRLALVSPGDGQGIVEGLRRVPPGSMALVVVSTADGQAIQAMGFLAKKLGRLVVVTLEGFGEPEPAAGVFTDLQRTGCYLVRCRQGNLEDALIELQQMQSQAAHSVGSTSGPSRAQSIGPAWKLEAAKAESPDSDASGPSYRGSRSINSSAGRI